MCEEVQFRTTDLATAGSGAGWTSKRSVPDHSTFSKEPPPLADSARATCSRHLFEGVLRRRIELSHGAGGDRLLRSMPSVSSRQTPAGLEVSRGRSIGAVDTAGEPCGARVPGCASMAASSHWRRRRCRSAGPRQERLPDCSPAARLDRCRADGVLRLLHQLPNLTWMRDHHWTWAAPAHPEQHGGQY